MALKEGDRIPAFSVKNQKGKTVTPESLKGKKVALFFYSEAGTPTCTLQACNMRDNYKLLKKAGYTVLGISPDTVEKQQKFIEKCQLPYDVLADTELEAAKAFGVWDWKTLFGNTYMGIHRTTFIIDENGIITNIIRKVQSKKHADQILK
ncbi:MAG TPA: thioredoxin-dependent thiol peroxidase [Bacteroidia bacterium]|nr:thioredoxin-dependent thiol peroxidase [Bacteroidia bacterium]